MTLDTVIMLCGAVVAVLPLLGLPNSWNEVLLFLFGVCIVALGIIVRRRGMGSAPKLPNDSRPVAPSARPDDEHARV